MSYHAGVNGNGQIKGRTRQNGQSKNLLLSAYYCR